MTISAASQEIGLHAVAAFVLLVLAASAWFVRDRSWFRWWHVGTRAFSLMLLAVTLLITVPKFAATLIGFGTELPGISVLVIELSNFALGFFPYLSVLGLMAVSSEMVLVEKLRRPSENVRGSGRTLAFFLSSAVSGGIALLVLFCGVGILMSFIKLANDLS